MMETFLYRRILPAAYDVLPAAMSSPPATALLLAVALQESGAAARRQQPSGPGRGFWQFEAGGAVAGVRTHPSSAHHLRSALVSLCYPSTLSTGAAWAAVEHNDVLAAVFARLLLWTVPAALPGRLAVAPAWDQYLAAWRPGKPRPDEWAANYALGWSIVSSETRGGA